MAKKGKRLAQIRSELSLDRHKLEDAVGMVKKAATAKFDETIELSINLGIDVRLSDQQVRGRATLPNGTGKTVRVAVFAKGDKADEAKAAGADIVGADELADQIKSGNINFDRCIATPDMMGVVGQLGRILGPRNLMPNPRLGTVTPNVADAVRAVKGGEITFRAEKAGIVHCLVGKASFTEKALIENVNAVIDTIKAAKPASSKKAYIRSIALSSTMGIGVKVAIDSSAR